MLLINGPRKLDMFREPNIIEPFNIDVISIAISQGMDLINKVYGFPRRDRLYQIHSLKTNSKLIRFEIEIEWL